MAFLGDDKLQEWTLAGRLTETKVIDKVPIDCRMVLAGPRSKVRDVPTQLGKGDLLTVATSYPKLLGQFAYQRGLNLAVTYMPSGGCEAYASKGRTDLVFDIMQSGDTLKANDLLVYRDGEQLNLNVVTKAAFTEPSTESLAKGLARVSDTYFRRVRETRENPELSSYTMELLRDPNRRTKKLGEEFAEVIQALLRRPANKQEIVSETADLLYVLGLWLACNGLKLSDALDEDISRNEQDNEED